MSDSFGSFRVVDLTRVLSQDMVLWPGTPPVTAQMVCTMEKDGYWARLITIHEHAGTHFDAPSHLLAGAPCVTDIDASQLVRPLRVIDISEQVGDDPDSVLEVEQVARHEREHGPILPGDAVFLRTGWDRYVNDPLRFPGGSGEDLHFPGYGQDSARLLVERGVVGLGIDTLGIDPGNAVGLPIHLEITHPAGLWHVEGAINLDQVPPVGALVMVGVLPLLGGTGAPARVLALVP